MPSLPWPRQLHHRRFDQGLDLHTKIGSGRAEPQACRTKVRRGGEKSCSCALRRWKTVPAGGNGASGDGETWRERTDGDADRRCRWKSLRSYRVAPLALAFDPETRQRPVRRAKPDSGAAGRPPGSGLRASAVRSARGWRTDPGRIAGWTDRGLDGSRPGGTVAFTNRAQAARMQRLVAELVRWIIISPDHINTVPEPGPSDLCRSSR